MRSDEATLITVYKDGTSFEEKRTDVFVNVKSITRAEFYAAYTANLAVKYAVELYPFEYDESAVIVDGKKKKAEFIEFDGARYRIIRAFQKNEEVLELTVGEL